MIPRPNVLDEPITFSAPTKRTAVRSESDISNTYGDRIRRGRRDWPPSGAPLQDRDFGHLIRNGLGGSVLAAIQPPGAIGTEADEASGTQANGRIVKANFRRSMPCEAILFLRTKILEAPGNLTAARSTSGTARPGNQAPRQKDARCWERAVPKHQQSHAAGKHGSGLRSDVFTPTPCLTRNPLGPIQHVRLHHVQRHTKPPERCIFLVVRQAILPASRPSKYDQRFWSSN